MLLQAGLDERYQSASRFVGVRQQWDKGVMDVWPVGMVLGWSGTKALLVFD